MSTRIAAGRMLAWAIALAFLFQIFAISPGIGHASDSKPLQLALLGSETGPATDFQLKDLNGADHRLSSYKGNRPVLLYFWATWCPACLSIKPYVASMRKDVPESELEILGINVGGMDSLERVQKFLLGHPAPYPTLYDDGGQVTKSYRVQGIPLFVLVDRDGKVVYRSNSAPSDIKQLIRKTR